MKPIQFEEHLKYFQKETVETLLNKSKEYSHGNESFWNFIEVAKEEGITAAKALSVLQAKQRVCVKEIVDNFGTDKKYSKEFIDEKLKDTINYYMLLWAMLLEWQGYEAIEAIEPDGVWCTKRKPYQKCEGRMPYEA